MFHSFKITKVVTGLVAVTTAGAVVCPKAQNYYEKNIKKEALVYGKTLDCKLEKVEPLTPDTSLFRFSLPSQHQVLGAPLSSYIIAIDDRSQIYREYTPITLDSMESDEGHFDLVIKMYPYGTLSRLFKRLQVGQHLLFHGPYHAVDYKKLQPVVNHIGMIAGGTGVTPMYQFIRTILNDEKDNTKISLLFANHSEVDIILKSQLDELARLHPQQFKLHYVIGDIAAKGETIDGLKKTYQSMGSHNIKLTLGRINSDAIVHFLPKPEDEHGVVLVCGPPGMLKFLCGSETKRRRLDGDVSALNRDEPLGGLLQSLGYDNHNIIRL